MALKGLRNIGNTCYLNSGLQLLIQNEDFCNLIINNETKTDNLKIISDFIKEYYISSNSSVTPNEIKTIVSIKDKKFRGNDQQDSAEFIVQFLDLLNDDLKGELYKLFEITSEITIKCKLLKCLKTSINYEKIPFLILPITDNDTTLDECYKNYKVHEKLEGSDMYYCDNCKAKRIASRRIQITGWSKHLIICLKRFNNNGSRLFKNNKEISIPFEWRHNFILKGAVIHSGGIGGGHYIFMSRDLNTNIWIMYDDSSTHTIRSEQVELLLNRAYIFHYVQK